MSDLVALVAIWFLILLAILLLASLIKIPETEYGVKSITVQGEEVRSIAEKKIADYFTKHQIKYIYEQEAKTKGISFSEKISNPDFYLPDYDVYVEFWGLVNVDNPWVKAEYVKNMKRKMAIYYQNKIKFISIYPSNLENLDWIFRKKFKKVTGFELPA